MVRLPSSANLEAFFGRHFLMLQPNIVSTFFTPGGDDVHQLCEAGEEEFLEIMALVGMASKPLHVRRLQKSLQEFVQNPGKRTTFNHRHCTLALLRGLYKVRSTLISTVVNR